MRRTALLLWLVLLPVCMAGSVFSAVLATPAALQLAHGPEAHHMPPASTAPAVPLPQDAAPSDDAWDLSSIAPQDMRELSQAPLAWSEIDWRAQLFSHWHNKLVHFPLVLGLVAALLRWRHWRYGGQTRQSSASPPLYTSFLTATTALALLAAFTGQQQAHPFMDGPLRQVLGLHQALGILSVLGFAALLWLDQRFPKQYLLLQTLGLSLLVALLWGTGLLGGLLAQSH